MQEKEDNPPCDRKKREWKGYGRMRILVYGAGVLGCNLAHDFYRAKRDVTILARNTWAQQIKQEGLTIRHLCRTTKDRMKVITRLEEEDIYDVIFVVMQYSQIDEILPVLQKNKSKTIVFVGNNLRAEEYEKALAQKQVLFAFYSACGKREETRVRSVALQKITIGPAKGKCNHAQIAPLFENTKEKVQEMSDMDCWLKTHAAFILPLAYACYYTGGDLRKIKRNDTMLNILIDAVREGYEVIKAAGYDIVPYTEYEYVTLNRSKCYSFFKLMCATFIGKMAITDHAMSAVKEMTVLSADFRKLKERSGKATPKLDMLENYLLNVK